MQKGCHLIRGSNLYIMGVSNLYRLSISNMTKMYVCIFTRDKPLHNSTNYILQMYLVLFSPCIIQYYPLAIHDRLLQQANFSTTHLF